MCCPTVHCSAPPWITTLDMPLPSNFIKFESSLHAGMKGKLLQFAQLIELHWHFWNKCIFKKHQGISNYAFFFHWEGSRVQSALLHLDSDVEEVVIAFTHGFSFFPWLAPDIDTMSADKDRTWVWVFLHCPSHPVFQILLLWCIFNNRHDQDFIIPGYIQGTKWQITPKLKFFEALTFAIRGLSDRGSTCQF